MNQSYPKMVLVIAMTLVAPSCDKARSLAEKARSQLAKQAGSSAPSAPDPTLQKLVDQTNEGVIFRKDLPFPQRLEVTVTHVKDVSLRTSEASAIEKSSKQIKGTQTEVGKFELAGNQLRYTNQEVTFVELGTAEDKVAAIRKAAKAAKPLVFIKTGSVWKSNEKDFLTAALSKSLSPVFDQILIENALAPRSLWFGRRRLKIGEQLTIASDELPMILTGKATGSFSLTLSSLDAVAGQPCGVFTLKGDYSRKQFPVMDGTFADDEVTVQSGKIWLSLLYPVILREELETIQTISSGGRGNLSTHSRGTVKSSTTRQWKILSD